MSLPRLTEIGDSAVLTVAGIELIDVDEGPAARFTFEGYPDDILTIGRMAVDGAFLAMDLIIPGGGRGNEPVIDYDGQKGETFKFARGTPKRGTRPTWRIEKVRPASPPAPSAPVVPPRIPEVASMPAAPAVEPPSRKPRMREESEDMQTPIERRAMIHAAYLRELDYVLGEPLKRAKKKKALFDVNAAVSVLLIEMAKRRCL